jgi:succinate dehydrogenase / fumarate reductase, iron-sulfur subunit
MQLKIYRFNPERNAKPYMQDFEVQLTNEIMLLDVLENIRRTDPTLSYRKSCREGICGSDPMNINGRNGLACLTNIKDLKQPVVLRPLPSFPVIRDLAVDLSRFFAQYHAVKPWLVNPTHPPEKERLQSPQQRESLEGLYECILCACCSSACPSYWWNPNTFLGPAALLQAARFIHDSRDTHTDERVEQLNDAYKLFRCRVIMNCADVCPKGLNPAGAIESIRRVMVHRSV